MAYVDTRDNGKNVVRLFVLTLLGFGATAAFSLAAAQDSASSDPVAIASADVPVAADAIPDWYQRFSDSDYENVVPEWTGRSETDVKIKLLESKRWNLQLALTSRDGDVGLPREEMWAGATFNITPRLSIGGAVGVGSDDLGLNAEWVQEEIETGIRLQSAFKF